MKKLNEHGWGMLVFLILVLIILLIIFITAGRIDHIESVVG